MAKAILAILDGWGLGKEESVDAIQAADTPFVDSLYRDYPNSTLVTYGLEVGLPEGQMGNSEVGHLNIGAGRVVYQEFARINKNIIDDTLKDRPAILGLIDYCKKENKAVHLLGLLSDGGVHSHINHIKSLVDIFYANGVESSIHVFLDGRDTSPRGGKKYLEELIEHCKGKGAKISTVIGRYYALDRDMRWERIKKSYDLLTKGSGTETDDFIGAVEMQYNADITDEFMEPLISRDARLIKENDAVLFFNFRTDRPRQLTHALTQADVAEEGMEKLNLKFVTMTNYKSSFREIDIVFDKDPLINTIGEVIADAGLTQVRIAETEKYPHVTFFFSGGNEVELKNEKRILIPSPKVATYDLQPEMSAFELTDAIVDEINVNAPDFVCLNYANADMVGHTGDFEAAKIAVTCVDTCLKKLTEVALDNGYELIVIADHGNSDIMMNADGSPHTAHTTNLVPIIHISKGSKGSSSLKPGKLADIAPTILGIMGVAQPSEMTGESLINN